jgi:hypothetical protein
MVLRIIKATGSANGYMAHDYKILNGTQHVGWVLISSKKAQRLPVVNITSEHHKLDRHALAVAIKNIDPDSWGQYFLASELVTFEDLEDKEFLKKMEMNEIGERLTVNSEKTVKA